MNKISTLCVILIGIPNLLHAQAITGDIPYAKKLLNENDNRMLKVWTMSEIRNDKTDTINPGGNSIKEKDIRSNPDMLGYHSLRVEKGEDAKVFSGTLDLTNAVLPAKIAILVDDTAILQVKEIGRKEGVEGPVFSDTFRVNGTALWNPRSYKEFPTYLPTGRKYKLDLTYSNTANLTPQYEGGVDIDGASVYVSLLPVELKDVNGAGEADDVTITPWDTSQNIADNNIAWIDAHQSAQNEAPRMPQLEFRVSGLPDGLTIEAKLKVQYTRGNGAREARNQAADRVRIPANGDFAQVNGDTWQLFSEADWQTELTERGFFGGEATLTYQIKQGGNIVVGPKEIDFRIGGENPDDARCRTYIENRPNAGPRGNLWFAYAIARSESRDYNETGSRYNQFLELPDHRRDVGRPLWGNDGGVLPGGYGMFQITGNVANSTANIPRSEIWDWRENVHAGLRILASKRTTADAWMARQKNAQNANGTALPNHTVRSVTFAEETNRTMNDAVTIKLYNGASSPPAGTDNGNVPGFLLDNGSGHYCFWKNASNKWALNRFNNPPAPIQPFNYVDRVCQEVEN